MKDEKKNKNLKKITKITHAEIDKNIGMFKTKGKIIDAFIREKKKGK